MKKKLQMLILLMFVLIINNTYGQTIKFINSPAVKSTQFALVNKKSAVNIIVDDNDYPAVRLAAGFFAQDIKRVTGKEPQIINSSADAQQMVIVGTLGKSKIIDKLVSTGKIRNIDRIKGAWEASLWQIINNPSPKIKKALVIIGSDRRGTVYGLTELSKKMGVSPWYWWADVPVLPKQTLTVSIVKPVWDKPAVKYRGIFINDEDWGMNQWARKTFESGLGSIGPKTYEKVFELMMRLKLNYLWPAMHEVSKEFGSITENWQLADRYGIVAGSSHCEPMLYNNVHWNEAVRGKWNYSINKDTIYKVWKNTAIERKDGEAVWTMGIRGIHDRGMETPPTGIPGRINLIEQVFKDQRSLIDQYVSKQWGSVAQCFVPYKEVLPVYDAGLKVPDNVTLIWVDDNFGYIRRLSNPSERKRFGGSGLYWHLSYYGNPHSYTWINTTAPALMWEEFHKAWENQARTMWVLNVGDIKPMELGIDYYSRLAWQTNENPGDAQPQFLKSFISENFGSKFTVSLVPMLNEFYRLGTVRKPEMMNRDWAISLSDKEAAQLTTAYKSLAQLEKEAAATIPFAMRDAYTELIGFPIRVLTNTGLIFMQDRASIYGMDAKTAQFEINRLKTALENQVDHYNNDLADGKWKYMMPGLVTGTNLPAWNSQVAWPWGETRKTDTSKKALSPNTIRTASSTDRRTEKGVAKWVAITGLGGSGRAMALLPATLETTWQPTDATAPSLEYTFNSNGKNGNVSIDFLPTFRIYPGMQLRVAVGVDKQLISTAEVPGSDGKEDENGPNRNQGIRNNYVRATIALPQLSPGIHRLFIRAIDPGVVVDKISFSML